MDIISNIIVVLVMICLLNVAVILTFCTLLIIALFATSDEDKEMKGMNKDYYENHW